MKNPESANGQWATRASIRAAEFVVKMITFFYLIIFVIIFLLAAVVKAGTEATKIGEGVKGQQAPPKKRGGGAGSAILRVRRQPARTNESELPKRGAH